MGEIVYSEDQETFHECDIVLDEADWRNVAGKTVTLYKGISVQKTHRDFINGDSIVEMIVENAYDNCGEFAEDYLADLTGDDTPTLEKLIEDWLNVHADDPSFYSVNDVKSFQYVVGSRDDPYLWLHIERNEQQKGQAS